MNSGPRGSMKGEILPFNTKYSNYLIVVTTITTRCTYLYTNASETCVLAKKLFGFYHLFRNCVFEEIIFCIIENEEGKCIFPSLLTFLWLDIQVGLYPLHEITKIINK